MHSKIVPQLEIIGAEQTDNDPPVEAILRTQLLDWACALDHEICTTTSATLVRKWKADGTNPLD